MNLLLKSDLASRKAAKLSLRITTFALRREEKMIAWTDDDDFVIIFEILDKIERAEKEDIDWHLPIEDYWYQFN